MKFRVKAFLIHLLLSVLVAGVGVLLIYLIWYPAPFAKAVGVTKIFFILLAVDVILGPLLTFLLASPKKSKRALLTDFSLIIIVQLAAYLYGMSYIASGRPVWVAYDNVRFEIADAVMLKNTEPNHSNYHASWFSGPKMVAVRPWKDAAEQMERISAELSGSPPSANPNLYVPIEHVWERMIEKQSSLSELAKINHISVEQIQADYPTATGYLPMVAPAVDMAVMIDANKRRVLGIADLNPYE